MKTRSNVGLFLVAVFVSVSFLFYTYQLDKVHAQSFQDMPQGAAVNLALAEVYQHNPPSQIGTAEVVGEGLPNEAAFYTFGFRWPVGSIVSKSGARFLITEDGPHQID